MLFSDDDDVFTDFDCYVFDFEDINECDTGNNTCTTAQVCFNFQGGYTCLNPLQCHPPYVEVSDKWVNPTALSPTVNHPLNASSFVCYCIFI